MDFEALLLGSRSGLGARVWVIEEAGALPPTLLVRVVPEIPGEGPIPEVYALTAHTTPDGLRVYQYDPVRSDPDRGLPWWRSLVASIAPRPGRPRPHLRLADRAPRWKSGR